MVVFSESENPELKALPSAVAPAEPEFVHPGCVFGERNRSRCQSSEIVTCLTKVGKRKLKQKRKLNKKRMNYVIKHGISSARDMGTRARSRLPASHVL